MDAEHVWATGDAQQQSATSMTDQACFRRGKQMVLTSKVILVDIIASRKAARAGQV